MTNAERQALLRAIRTGTNLVGTLVKTAGNSNKKKKKAPCAQSKPCPKMGRRLGAAPRRSK